MIAGKVSRSPIYCDAGKHVIAKGSLWVVAPDGRALCLDCAEAAGIAVEWPDLEMVP